MDFLPQKERFFQVFPLHNYTLQSTERFQVFLSITTLYNLLRGFSKVFLFMSTLPERFFKSTFSSLPEVFASFFLSTTLHPSTYQEIYMSSPQFYIPPRNIGILSTILHSTTYNQQPTHYIQESIQQSRSLAKRRRKSRTNNSKTPHNLVGLYNQN